VLKKKYTNQDESLVSFVETPPELSRLMVNLISKPKNIEILDTGCGRGIYLNTLILSGFKNIEGIELNKILFNFCKSSFKDVTLYNHDYLEWESSKKYDVIIGNPPYLHYSSLPAETQKRVFKITKTGESDIYYAFIIKSIELLKANGELIYIVPYQFFYNTHAEIVRKKIVENGYFEIIIDLDEVRLFKGENPEPIIFKFIKNVNNIPKKIKVLRLKKRNTNPGEILQKSINALNEQNENELFYYYTKQEFRNYKEIWSSYPQIILPKSVKLCDVAFVGVGLVSGFDKAFRVTDNEIKHFNKNEKNLIHKFIKAINCEGFWISGYEKYILMDEKIKDESNLSRNYPNVFVRLIEYKDLMTNRYLPNRKRWFHWQAKRNKKLLDKYMDHPKIFVPALDRSKLNRFSISENELKVYPSGDVLVIIPFNINPFYLLGYLNSDFFRNYYLSHGAKRGNRIAFTQRIMSNVKIPAFNNRVIKDIAKITKEILITNDHSKRKTLNNVINTALEQIKL